MAILVPRGHDTFGQHQGSRPLARPDFLSKLEVLVLYFLANQICQNFQLITEAAGGPVPWC